MSGNDGRQEEMMRLLQRAVDYQRIQNLMSLRAYYHSAFRNDLELPLYAQRPDVCWGQNQGYWVGIDSIRRYYVDGNVRLLTDDLIKMSRRYPSVKADAGNLGCGNLAMHTLTTGIIEIAKDGQTAKGLWYSPGILVGAAVGGNEEFDAGWMWEKYAVDFIKEEDGEWKFWHLNVLTDWSSRPPPLAVSEGTGLSAEEIEGSGVCLPEPDIKRDLYEVWSRTRVPHLQPRPPEPYETFSQTFSYGP